MKTENINILEQLTEAQLSEAIKKLQIKRAKELKSNMSKKSGLMHIKTSYVIELLGIKQSTFYLRLKDGAFTAEETAKLIQHGLIKK